MDSKESDAYRLPVTVQGVEALLAGGLTEGIGPVFARRLTERFGTQAPEVLMERPDEAAAVPGIGVARAAAAGESLRRIACGAECAAFLLSCGVSGMMTGRIIARYGRRTAEVVRRDPYEMIEDVWQLSFRTADRIGRVLGIAPDDPRRLRGALVTAVKMAAEEGHLFATPAQAGAGAAALTGEPAEAALAQTPQLVEAGRLVESRGVLYLPVFYKAEKEGAARLSELAARPVTPIDAAAVPERSREGHLYSEAQRRAIMTALSSAVSVITGGPGSGKTTVLRGITECVSRAGLSAVLVAPTGRAAKRMSAATGTQASTIHRLLGYRRGEGYRARPIPADVLIIDEGSMMEQVLLRHLLDAVGGATRVIVVGDPDQLPAIGAGDVLRDLIASGVVPVARLDGNFRQAAGGGIAAAARAINSGTVPGQPDTDDFVLITEPSAAAVHDRVIQLVTTGLPASRGLSPADIVVVTPQQVGPLGARRLNAELQQLINPSGPELRSGTTVFRAGDPVMQRSNSRDRGVYNGETGRVTSVDPDRQTLTVRFADGGPESVYTRRELSELTLGYATTIHKIQGSEARNVVIPVTTAHHNMLYRNLLYTGVSRATDLCVVVAEPEALAYAVEHTPDSARNSNFRYRLHAPAS